MMFEARLLLYAIGSFICVVHCQTGEDGFALELRELFPCQKAELGTNVSLHKSDILAVQADLTLCNNSSWSINQFNGFRIHAKSEASSSEYPVVFIARESTNGILTFGLPLQPEGFSLSFLRANRTVCPILYQNKSTEVANPPPLLYIDVFTSSVEPQSYSIIIEPVKNFTLQLDETYQTTISPSSPQIYYFKMPDRVKAVTIEVATKSRRCAIVSVQNNTCPINDLLENARSKGIYQTMSTSAFLTVEESQMMDREFVLVLIATNYSICHDRAVEPELVSNTTQSMDEDASIIRNDEFYKQTLSITIRELESTSRFWLAILLPVLVYLFLYPLTFVVLFGCCPHLRCVPTWDLKHPYGKPCKCVGFTAGIFCCCERGGKAESFSLIHKNGNKGISLTSVDGQITDPQTGSTSNGKSLDQQQSDSETGTDVKLPRMNKKGYRELDSRYSVYGWNTITVGIFYALPAFQLVLSEQRILNLSGNEDQCYYNFKCAHPFGVLSTFNAVWSNIGFVLLGLLFILVVTIRKCRYIKQRNEDQEYVDSHGVPQFFGIYYAMGIALILEGFMSSFYHICPTDANFQFDTAFMFIIGGLLLVKLFQNRHPDIHANAFIAFFSFAVIIVLTLLGIYFNRRDPIAVRLPIFILILLLMVLFLFSFYNFHEWKWGLNLAKRVLQNLKDCILCKRGPKHRVRFIKLVVAFVINVILAIAVVAGYKKIDIATAVLVFFLTNLLFFLILYILSKLWHKEPLTWLILVLPLIFTVVWGAAFYFFMGVPVSNWKLTPAESRELNKECSLLGFYDNHDIWHFLAAFGLFFSFLFILVLDDGVADVKREDLHIF